MVDRKPGEERTGEGLTHHVDNWESVVRLEEEIDG